MYATGVSALAACHRLLRSSLSPDRKPTFSHDVQEQAGAGGRAKASVCCHLLFGIAGSNPAEGMYACRECCVLSGRGLCDELITRPEESYSMVCV